MLKAVGPSTRVGVQRTVTVAGQPAYQLVLSPKSSGSLVGRVSIAIDASNNVPLRVQVFARGASSPAFQVGYTAISFVQPAPANFSFAPPAGAKVNTVTAAQRGRWPAQAVRRAAAGGQPGPGDREGLAVRGGVPRVGAERGHRGQHERARRARWPSRRCPAARPGSGNGETAAILHTLIAAATPVHGAWGSGQLLHTSLVSMLITSNGHVLIGAVTPAVLENAAAQLK